jgi:hypothetical protein
MNVNSAGRMVLVADLIVALVALWFVLPRSFVPASPDHYWSPDTLITARYLTFLFIGMAVLAAIGWFSRLARFVLLGVIALLALKTLNDFRLEMQLAASTEITLTLLARSGRFWLDVAFGLLPAVWLALHLWLFAWRRAEMDTSVHGSALKH